MPRPALGVRVLGALLSRTSVSRLTDEQIARMQTRTPPRNRVLDALLGARAAGVTATDTTLGRGLPARVYTPDDATDPALVVFFHGGGFVFGDLDGHDAIASAICAGTGAVVVSASYRLAPAHPWPAAPDDAWAALVEAVRRAPEWGADPDRVAVAGDSAGATLAAVVALRARDEGGPALRAQGLSYPAPDSSDMSAASFEENAAGPVLTADDVRRFRDLYLPDEADRSHPYASPARATSHAGLPPALVQVGELDPLRDPGLAYADTLRAAGVPVRTTTYVGMPHGFLSFPGVCRSAPQAMAELTTFLADHLR